ncbi:unnamed protein product [Moneuplotes crassus]|uniref:START domain-containing protein n=1 Tax=Euplotes crassus TaxID=5936 RepID=A0AAD1XLZ4_EUPCR|nr:unnamed protein product [Moneuplotes crassus]
MEHFKSRTTVIKRLGMLKAHLTAARTGDDIYKNVLPKDLINEELKASISHFEQKHQDNILKAKHKFLDYQQMIMKPGWKLEKEIKYKGGSGKLWSNSDKKSGLNAILREIEINVPHIPACDFFKDEIRFSKLNENLKETKIVEDLKNESSYIYHCFKGNIVVSDRDFSLFKHCFTLPDGRFAIVSFSVNHPKMPERRKKVRAHADLSVYLITPMGDDKILVQTIQNGDPKGSIPTALVNNRATKQLDALVQIKKHLEKTIRR